MHRGNALYISIIGTILLTTFYKLRFAFFDFYEIGRFPIFFLCQIMNYRVYKGLNYCNFFFAKTLAYKIII